MYTLTDEMIAKNKETFINILKPALEIRGNANIEGLFKKLESSDFFVAPASTRYHGAYKGGLVDHSLNVYYNTACPSPSRPASRALPLRTLWTSTTRL